MSLNEIEDMNLSEEEFIKKYKPVRAKLSEETGELKELMEEDCFRAFKLYCLKIAAIKKILEADERPVTIELKVDFNHPNFEKHLEILKKYSLHA